MLLYDVLVRSMRNMNTLNKLKIHDPAKAAVLNAFFDIVENQLKDKDGRSVWDEDKAREEMEQTISNSVYGGGGFLKRDQLGDYETEFWPELEHMTIADYCPDAKKIHEFGDIETRYYQELERIVLESKLSEIIIEVKEKLEAFYWYLDDLDKKTFWGESEYKKDTFDFNLDMITEFTLSGSCPHGWASHTDEREENDLHLYRWLNGQVDGLNAISLSLYGGAFWATMTIDPKDNRGMLWEMRQ